MPRQGRKTSNTGFYHVVCRGNNKEHIFGSEENARLYTNLLKQGIEKYQMKVYAYCIMVNHAHILIRGESEQLSAFMQHVNSIFAERYNNICERCGHVFQGRYYRDCIEDEEYFWCCMRYIHNNPVKIDMVKNPYEYLFSSAREIYTGKLYLIDKESYRMVLRKFGNKPDFWAFHRLYENKSFFDTVEDMRTHNHMRVINCMTRYMFDHRLDEISTLMTIGEYHEEFIEYCIQETNLSRYKIENILKMAQKRD